MFQLTVQAGDAVAERVHRPFTGGELALQHHQAQGIAGEFRIEALTAAGIEHPEQRFKTEAKIGFTATEHRQRRLRIEVDDAVQRHMQGIAVAMSLMRQLLNQSRRLANASQRQGDVIVILRHTYSLSAARAVRPGGNNACSGLQRQSLFNNSAAEAHFP